MTSSVVEHPSHYISDGMECIEAIKGMLGEKYPDYCRGNVLKYIWRYRDKNGVEDLEKARTYLDFMINDLNEIEGDLDEFIEGDMANYNVRGYLFPRHCKLNALTYDAMSNKVAEECGEAIEAINAVKDVVSAAYCVEDESRYAKARFHAIEELMDVIATAETCLRKFGVDNVEYDDAVMYVTLKNKLRGYYGMDHK